MAPSSEKKFSELIRDFDVAMLVTRTADGRLRSRPMALADIDENGTLWFMTQSDSGKIDEIESDERVNVSMQSKFKFVSITGIARPVRDHRKIDQLWNDSWKSWFPGGKDDPALVLLEVRGDEGEYWDNSGSAGIKYLIEAGKAYLSGTRPDVAGDPKIHGKVAL